MARLFVFGLISGLALGVGLGGCGGDGADRLTTTASNATTATTAADVKMVDLRKAGARMIKLDGDWLVATEDAIWVNAGPEFDVLNPETGQSTGHVSVPGGLCLGGVYAYGAMYSATCYSDKGMVRIDPKTLSVTDEVPLATPDLYNQEGTIDAGEGAIWIVLDGKGCESCVLAGLDPKTLEMTHEIGLDPGAESVAVGNGLVWVSDSKRNRVLRIDPRTDKVVGETKVGGLPRYIAFASNGLWVLNQLDGTVMQLDPQSGEVVKTIEADMAGAGGSITVAEGSVWVRGTLTLLKQIDPATGKIVAQYGPDSGSGDALVEDGVLWVSASLPGHVGTSATADAGGVVYRLPLSQAD
jgi:DNA-binding beta-propeller fold protein YncE